MTFLEKNFQNFYSFSEEKKREIIVAHLEYVFENKRQISNWLFHFYCVTNSVINPNFNVDAEVLKEDEDLIESLKPSLAILKGYLIMYRLQNEVFDVIDYDKVDLDFDDNEMWFWSENKEEYESIKKNLKQLGIKDSSSRIYEILKEMIIDDKKFF